MKDRIKQIMESQQMSQKDFADKLKISASTLSGIFNGRTEPTFKVVNAIHETFPSINIEWLMWGTGAMLSPMLGNVNNGENREANISDSEIAQHENPPLMQKGDSLYAGGDLFSHTSEKIAPEPKVIKETKIIRRAVKEIRVFYDDGTYESFAPAN